MYLFILLVVEIILLVVVGMYIGAGYTFLLIIGTCISGIYFLIRAIRSFKRNMENHTLKDDISGNIGYIVGAIFLMLPGFFTDSIGLLLVLPFTRPVFIRIISEVSLIFSSGFFVDLILSRLHAEMKNAKNTKPYPTEDELVKEKAQEKEEWKNSHKKVIDADYKDLD